MGAGVNMGWIEWLNANHGFVSAVAAVFIALFAFITVGLTWALARENRLIRKSGTEPKVVAYLVTDSHRPQAINFVLANVGRGTAKNVEFTIEADMCDFKDHEVSDVFRDRSGGRGTDLLPQGERIQSFFGMAQLLLRPTPLRCFTVHLTWEDLNDRTQKSQNQLDVAQLGWISWLERGT